MNQKKGFSLGKLFLIILTTGMFLSCEIGTKNLPQKENSKYSTHLNQFVADVKVIDSFWAPKLIQWSSVTVNDVFNKFEGQYDINSRRGLIDDYKRLGRTRDAFLNFDLVAQGKRGIKQHDGPEWYDGLVYESISGASDFLKYYPNKEIEERIDRYVDRIEAAQNSVGDGYINTYTLLVEPEHKWGLNGGFERGQHDVYNSGALIEAGIHYYKATGKTKLLNIAVKCANNICKEIGPAPKKNVIPGHALPEEAMVKLYWLFKDHPDLKNKMTEKVNEADYYDMAKFWIETRGYNCGLPKWGIWSYKECDKWIRDNKYTDPKYGNHSRPSWGKYNQDSIPFDQQKTIEGHAVRATLFATGVTATALENKDTRYVETISSLWDNMVGKRMYITGGVGAFRNEEMFGPDYILPSDSYCETCAAVGSCFFSSRMAELHANGKYIDEFERSLYNNILSGVSLSGDNYSYENSLVGKDIRRWNWHECPCCPPMFLKLLGNLPGYIYSQDNSTIYVNLFIGSVANINLNQSCKVEIKQTTNYPWEGNIAININPDTDKEFTIKVRIPGWAQGVENPYDLYKSDLKTKASLKLNGKTISMEISDGFASLTRKWTKGDVIDLNLPIEPRFVFASNKVKNLNGMVSLASGPIVYGLEESDNPGLSLYKIDINTPVRISYKKEVLNGVNILRGKAINGQENITSFTAIPSSAINNRVPGNAFQVWSPVKTK